MKKILGICLSFLISLSLLVGCSCKKDEDKDDGKASLQVGDMNAQTYVTLTMSQLNEKINNKDSFVLFAYLEGCYGCQLFKPILENAIRERNLIVYAINARDIEKGHEIRDVIEYTPSIFIYKEGTMTFMSDPVKNEEYFSSNAGFLKLLDTYTDMPTLYYISKSQLDEKIANGESFIIYYSRSSCSDCSYLNRNYLKTYLNENDKTKKFYIIETDAEGIRYTNDEYDAELWQSFKDSYGLSNANNSLGHGVGYVPTLQYYEDGVVKEMMVYFNDCEYIQNGDGSYSVVINNSYYSDNPYLNQTLSASEYKDLLSPFYNQKLKSFLDSNLKKVD